MKYTGKYVNFVCILLNSLVLKVKVKERKVLVIYFTLEVKVLIIFTLEKDSADYFYNGEESTDSGKYSILSHLTAKY